MSETDGGWDDTRRRKTKTKTNDRGTKNTREKNAKRDWFLCVDFANVTDFYRAICLRRTCLNGSLRSKLTTVLVLLTLEN